MDPWLAKHYAGVEPDDGPWTRRRPWTLPRRTGTRSDLTVTRRQRRELERLGGRIRAPLSEPARWALILVPGIGAIIALAAQLP